MISIKLLLVLATQLSGILAHPINTIASRSVPGTTLSEYFSNWNGNRGGVNTVFNTDYTGNFENDGKVYKPDDVRKAVNDAASASIGFLRIGVFSKQLDTNEQQVWDVLDAAIQKGDEAGVVIQVSFRNDGDVYKHNNGPGTLPGSTEQTEHYVYLLQKIVNRYKEHQSFVIDTFNEPEAWYAKDGGSAGWIDLQKALISGIRSTGYEGFIVVEDGDNGGGYADGYYSAISKYIDQLKEANGGPNHLIGSFHSYVGDFGKVKNELEHITNAGITPQVGEYGNAAWTGSEFQRKPGAIEVIQKALDEGLFGEHGSHLVWYEVYPNDNSPGVEKRYGYSSGEQLS